MTEKRAITIARLLTAAIPFRELRRMLRNGIRLTLVGGCIMIRDQQERPTGGGWAIWLIAVGSALFYSWFILAYYHSLEFDTSVRYAVMAEEFAAGNFNDAFHPRFGVFIQVVAGSLVWLTGMDGFSACQLFAVFGWCISAVPLWYVFREAFDEESAWWSIAFLLIVPLYFKLSGDGMRDNMRMLSVALCALGFCRAKVWQGSQWTSVGVFLGTILRGDAVLTSGAVAAAYVIWQICHRKWLWIVWPVFAWTLGCVLNSMMIYHYTGVFVPISQAVDVVRRIMP